MKFIADFHIHSKYSRATSRDMDLEHLDRWAGIKGIDVLGTGDFTHPGWFKNIKTNLKPAEQGLFSFEKSKIRFILTAEISCIYTRGGKVRKIHIIVFAPSLEVVEKINSVLGKRGNIKSDGRPILGMDAEELTKIILDISEDCLIVPAHCMTPWFALFGSKSGFDSIQECFGDYSKYIYALETGLSADPAMIRKIPDGRKLTVISNSDSHSPQKIGREANVFDTEKNYQSILKAIKDNDPKRFLYTIEFFSEEGKYHYDGHRSCNLSLSPIESKKYNNICPKCRKPLTIGVLNRVEKMSDNKDKINLNKPIPFKKMVPLTEIISEAFGVKSLSKKGEKEYEKLIKVFGTEFKILLETSYEDLKRATLPLIAEGIIRVREGKVLIVPGYDGVYGKVVIFSEKERKNLSEQSIIL